MKTKPLIVLAFVVIVLAMVYLALTPVQVATKPQEPTRPYPYTSEDVTFANPQAGITLAGTFTFPKKASTFPVVVLITGSGPQDRNEELLGHKPFQVIADHLTRQGIAVLRYDDRGTGQSTGHFMSATSLDFASDAQSAVAYLKTRKEINPQKIGVAGHSEGGLVAAMAASQTNDVGFIISMAGPGVKGIKVISLQAELIAQAGGASEKDIATIRKANLETIEILQKSADTTVLRAQLTAYTKEHMQDYPEQLLPPGQTKEQFFKNQINAMCTPWYQFLYQVDPQTYFQKVTCPVLAINGTKDLQVDARQNLPAIAKALKDGGNSNVTIKELPSLNHLFQECKTGHPSEYSEISQTFSPLALNALSDWITAVTSTL